MASAARAQELLDELNDSFELFKEAVEDMTVASGTTSSHNEIASPGGKGDKDSDCSGTTPKK